MRFSSNAPESGLSVMLVAWHHARREDATAPSRPCSSRRPSGFLVRRASPRETALGAVVLDSAPAYGAGPSDRRAPQT
jgi:hypothetical protein